MRALLRSAVTLFVLFSLVMAEPCPATATDPGSNVPMTVPPRDPGGSIVLPNGKVLPVAPAGTFRPSQMAEALPQHAHDKITFESGNRPMPRGTSTTTASAVSGSSATATLLGLASGGGSGATATLAGSLPNGLRKQVFGFLPYWELSASSLQWMEYDKVSTIAYFGVAARSNGSLATSSGGVTTTTWAGWTSSAMTSVINAAHQRGDRVVLTVTMMAWDSTSAAQQATLLGSSTYRQNLINNIIGTVRNRNADGVNLDFEPVSSTTRSQYTSFVRQLKAALVSAGAGSYLTVCTMAGAATWASGYDIAGLTASGAADALFVMGYDYSGSWSSRAGGIAPMSSSYMLDVNESVNDYLTLTSGSKLIWGVPYYGEIWQTTAGSLNASTVSGGYFAAFYYTSMKAKAATYGRKWDALGQVPWFAYQANGSWYEGYYDDVQSLAVKYDMINQRGLGGVGIWHLQMDQGTSELWNLLANRFQNDTVPPAGGISRLPALTDAYAIPVTWRAVDVGSGVASYDVQVRDWAHSYFTSWLTAVTSTAALYVGQPGHVYEFRVSARDRLGNLQPWVPAMVAPGTSLAIGGFAGVQVSLLNVRSGAGTSFTSLEQLPAGSEVAILSGPVASDGYQWYQVQFNFNEWPSADYPRTGWAAAGDSSGQFLVPSVPPTATRIAPQIGGYMPTTTMFSPNGDDSSDSASVDFSLPSAASSVRLDVLDAAGTQVDSTDLGTRNAGAQTATWDGHLSGGGWAPAGKYLLRITAVDASGTHVAPSTGVDAAILNRWGVLVDTTPPTMSSWSPIGNAIPVGAGVRVTFSEPVSGVSGASFALVDWTTMTVLPASVSYDSGSRTATLQPSSPLVAGRTYRAWLGSAIHDLAGNPLTSASWPFSTEVDTTPPTMSSWSPIGNAIPVGAGVRVTFSEPVSGVSGASFALVDWTTMTVLPASVSYDSGSRTATLQPSSPLVAGRTYRAWLGSAIHDLAGNPLTSASWPFSTEVDTTPPTMSSWSPIGNAIPVGAGVRVTFSEPVSGVSGASFALVDWTTMTVLPASVSYDSGSRTATLQPSSPLVAGRTYRAWLGSAIHDLAGNPLTSASWPFSTASAP